MLDSLNSTYLKKLLYIGNNLKNTTPTSIILLSRMLGELGYEVYTYSKINNKLFRLFDMCFGVLKHRKADFVLVDTYSTLNFYYAFIISQLARILKIKYIPILRGGNLPFRLVQNPKLCELIFKNAFINVALSNYLLENFKRNDFKTIFIPNIINIKNYNFKERIIVEPKLLWVRAFDTIYNPEMAIKVLSVLKKTHPNASLCMVGPDKDGSLEQSKSTALKYGVQDAVEFTGLLDKKTWIERSKEFSIFINTTTVDNTPVSVLEAMALGLPVVSTNVGGIPYLINNSVNGVLVENNNELEMANAIVKLIEDPIETLTMSKNARKLVEGFDVEVVKKEWRKLLN